MGTANSTSPNSAIGRETTNATSKEHDGTLPKAVKLILEAAHQQAQAVGIVMALFAGALVSLAQILEGVDKEKPVTNFTPRRALRVFLYGAIMLNLLGAFLSLMVIKLCSDLPIASHQRASRKKAVKALPDNVDPLSREGVLRAVGMSQNYFYVDTLSAWVLILACVCSFTALTLWVIVNTDDYVTIGFTISIFISCGLIFLVTARLVGRAQGWT